MRYLKVGHNTEKTAIMIFPAQIKTIFPVLNIEESKLNGLDNLIADLHSCSDKITLPIKHFGNPKLKFKFSDKPDFNDFSTKKEYKLFLTIESELDLDCFKIAEDADMKSSGEGEIPAELYEFIKEKNPDFSPKWADFPSVFMVPVAYKLFHRKYLKHFLVMTQLAHPGTLWLDDAHVFMGDKRIEDIEGFTSILYEYDYKNNTWPSLNEIGILKVWNYVINKTNILEEFSKTEIERAFNAYTYIFSKHYIDNVPVSLFWTISGLESLFVKGEVGITQQLDEKIQVFLGNIEKDKKRLKKLYNYRSALIHGGLNIPISHTLFEDDKYQTELHSMNAFAAVVLVACLQKIIQKDMISLNFRYEYE